MLAGIRGLGGERRVRRRLRSVERARGIRLARLVAQHQHGLSRHVEPGVVVPLQLRRRDPVAREDERGIGLAVVAEIERPEVDLREERHRASLQRDLGTSARAIEGVALELERHVVRGEPRKRLELQGPEARLDMLFGQRHLRGSRVAAAERVGGEKGHVRTQAGHGVTGRQGRDGEEEQRGK